MNFGTGPLLASGGSYEVFVAKYTSSGTPLWSKGLGIQDFGLGITCDASGSSVLTGEFAKVQMASTSFGGLIDWLDDAQKTARLSVVEASITALPAVGMVDANITLRQQKSE